MSDPRARIKLIDQEGTKIMYCEDYPCCGHTPSDPCDGAGYIPAEDYYKHFSADDYDPYYDMGDY